MRVLITGGTGFVGRYLARELLQHGHEPVLTDRPDAPGRAEGLAVLPADVASAADMERVVAESRPEACAHLAGISFVPDAEADPCRTLQINTAGTLHVVRAMCLRAPAGARTLFVSTAHVYADGGVVLSEDAALAPRNMYAATKAAAEMVALAHAARHGASLMVVRPNNHTGPGQPPNFMTAALASQIAAVRAGRGSMPLRVGNVESRRVVMDVRDVVAAYRLLLERGDAGRVYNLSTDRQWRVLDVLQCLCELAGVAPEYEVDPALHRPTDRSPVLDTTRLRACTGWTPRFELRETLADILRAAGESEIPSP